jgi:hypothetical protein
MRNIVAGIILLTAFFGCAEKFDHDRDLAAKRAVEFAEETFVRRNSEKGYALLADKARSYVPMEKFTEKLTKMHPSSHPQKITVVGAEPVLGEKIVHIRLRGEGANGSFEYAVTVVGTAATDYRVTTFSGGRAS